MKLALLKNKILDYIQWKCRLGEEKMKFLEKFKLSYHINNALGLLEVNIIRGEPRLKIY